jgi:hypothetical protein
MACSISSVDLRWCSSVSWALLDACSLISLPRRYIAPTLCVGLSSVGSCLFHLIGLLSHRGKPDVYLWYGSP